ncbi:hypothetical protein UREG_03019 [Uncinocarpus reesii 1704]|uniref:SBDS family rRNA metabolism protein n=1 Tax=Uncinocarpus reesii (strain UAMH 1704) TaxID=336963 RepID=C4JNM1_UNCRE|nr:uncharacterized protein UREG_03019 [Uncinocarpus reesii 1704]EEP78174.1 hypothetical protein UREG_03019 [Uncinocarpus reesii 1704]
MPVGINQPSNQIKFTNVSIVRLKKEYRTGAEADLDNVLQVPTVFLSVSKAQTAPAADLAKSFGSNAKREDIVQEILRKGEVQVGEKERKELLERVEREVLEIVSARLVDPVSKRVYTTGMISKALDQLSAAGGQQGGKPKPGGESPAEAPLRSESGTPVPASEELSSQRKKPLWTGVVTTKSAKSQALDAMKALIAWQPVPVMRARMRLRITCPTSILKQAARSTTNPASGAQKNSKGKGKKGKKADDSDEEAREIGGTQDTATGTGTVKDRILHYFEQVESQEILGQDEWEVIGFAEPGAFKGLSEFVGGETKGRGRVEVLDMAVTHEE